MTLPCAAQYGQVAVKRVAHLSQVAPREAVILAQNDGPYRAIQADDSFMPSSQDVHMRRPVIIGVDDDA